MPRDTDVQWTAVEPPQVQRETGERGANAHARVRASGVGEWVGRPHEGLCSRF